MEGGLWPGEGTIEPGLGSQAVIHNKDWTDLLLAWLDCGSTNDRASNVIPRLVNLQCSPRYQTSLEGAGVCLYSFGRAQKSFKVRSEQGRPWLVRDSPVKLPWATLRHTHYLGYGAVYCCWH